MARDYAKAADWYTKAAKQGVALAQNNLGWMYHEGRGVARDDVRAYMWLNAASANGNKAAFKNLDLLEDVMTSQQIEKAQSLTRRCIAKHYKGC